MGVWALTKQVSMGDRVTGFGPGLRTSRVDFAASSAIETGAYSNPDLWRRQDPRGPRERERERCVCVPSEKRKSASWRSSFARIGSGLDWGNKKNNI